MPSKRTNDSVDRILEELSQKQMAEGVRAGAQDSQVDEILRSVGLVKDDPVVPTGAFSGLGDTILPDDVLDDLTSGFAFTTDGETTTLPPLMPPAAPTPARGAARPAQSRGTAAPQRPAEQQRQTPPRQAQEPPRQAAQPAPRRQAAPARPAPQGRPAAEDTGADTTQTGVIKNFLRQAMPGDVTSDSTAIFERKEQFKNFFKESVAVVPDENGRIKQPAKPKKRRGLFGFGGETEETGDVTDEFVPINVAMTPGARRKPAEEEPPLTASAPEPELEEDAFGSTAPRGEEPPKRKKRGLFGRRRQQEEELVIPEAREETIHTSLNIGVPARPVQAVPAEQPAPERVYHSKYAGARRTPEARPAERQPAPARQAPAQQAPVRQPPERPAPAPSGDMTGNTLTAGQLSALRAAVSAKKQEETGKKPTTVEFTPGQEPRGPQVTPPTIQADGRAEPVAEPVMRTHQPVSGSAPRQEPADQIALAQTPPEPVSEPSGFSVHMDAIRPDQLMHEISTGEISPAEINAAADAITRTITGQIDLNQNPEQPDGGYGDYPDEAPTLVGQPGFAAPVDPTARDNAPTAVFAAQPQDMDQGAPPDTSEFVRDIAHSINTDSPTTSRFAEAAQRLTEELPDGQTRRGKRAGRTRLTGSPDDEHFDEEGEPIHPFEDKAAAAARSSYEKGTDTNAVRGALDKKVLGGTLAAIVSAVAAAVLLYLGTAAMSTAMPLPDPLDPLTAPGALLGVCLILLAASCGACWRTMASGLRGLFRMPTADTLPALAGVAGIVQLLLFLLKNSWYRPADLCLFAGPAALLLCFNSIGKALDARTVRNNFDLVSAGVDHAVAYRLRDARVVHAITQGLSEPNPSVLVSRPTVLLKSFMADSYSRRTSDKNQQQFAWALGGCALLSLIFNLAVSKDPGKAVTAMTAVLCLGTPLAGTLLSALPAQLMQRSAARVGAVIPGWKDIRQLGRTNVVQLTARDLFPASCVKLHGIKTFRKERIDLAIVYAASMLVDANPTLRDVFLGMIGHDKKLLYKVDDLRGVPGKGCVGWIDDNRVLVGNRHLMEKYDIQIPAEEYEQRFTVNQRKVIYLAVSGNLFSMFLVSYERDNDTAAVLENLQRNGVSMVITTDDFDCDDALVEAVYGLPAGSVKVLSPEENDALAPATAWLPESEGSMLHLGNFASFVGGLEAAAGAAEGERKAGFVVTASVLISCVLAVVMSIAGGIVSLPLPAMVLYQAGWAALALIFPLLQKY